MANYQPLPTLQVAERIYKTNFTGLYYLDHALFPDDRGSFAELALIEDLESVIKHPFAIAQLNLAHSKNNVIRGFHAEGWNKLVTLVRGTAFSALLDLRPNSPTFGQVETFLLGDSEKALHGCLFIPIGIANSVCVTHGPVDYLYCVDRLYRDRDPQGDAAISLFDPDLKVPWPIAREDMILSGRDADAVTLRHKYPNKFKQNKLTPSLA